MPGIHYVGTVCPVGTPPAPSGSTTAFQEIEADRYGHMACGEGALHVDCGLIRNERNSPRPSQRSVPGVVQNDTPVDQRVK